MLFVLPDSTARNSLCASAHVPHSSRRPERTRWPRFRRLISGNIYWAVFSAINIILIRTAAWRAGEGEREEDRVLSRKKGACQCREGQSRSGVRSLLNVPVCLHKRPAAHVRVQKESRVSERPSRRELSSLTSRGGKRHAVM